MKILGIESSCDETSASIIEVKKKEIRVLSNIISSQVKIHAKYGGVVPEVAARQHVEMIIPVIEKAFEKAKIKKDSKSLDLITVTRGPGLITSLAVGIDTAKTLSYLWQKPLVSVNHLAGHIYSNLLPATKKNNWMSKVQFPLLCLLVSGGHTELILMKDWEKFKVVGETLDDAAGEAFDKVAKILSLGYPGGPEISRLAKEGNVDALDLPRPMLHSGDFDFSFSGLKTAVLYADKKQNKKNLKYKKDMCASFEQSVVDVLIAKTVKVAEKYGVKTVWLGGGVSANKKLRNELKRKLNKKMAGVKFSAPVLSYTGDNAAMIALAGYFKYQYGKSKKIFDNTWKRLDANPNWEL